MSPTKEEALEPPNTRRPERPATPIQGFEETNSDEETADQWQPVADRKIRVGIAGYGVCGFGAAFHFQDHPNVTVAAVADLNPDKCAELARLCRCDKTYSCGSPTRGSPWMFCLG